jgi:hypothetical protein
MRAPLANLTNRAVADVKIDRIQLATAPVQTPLPMTVGAVPARSSVIVQAELYSQSLLSGQRYELVMQGTYRGQDTYRGHEDAARKFRVHTFVVIPPPSEGSGQLGTTQVPSHYVEGGRYPHQPPRMDKDVNSGAPPVPTNPEVPGAPTPTGTEAKPAPIGDPPAIRFRYEQFGGDHWSWTRMQRRLGRGVRRAERRQRQWRDLRLRQLERCLLDRRRQHLQDPRSDNDIS